MANENTSITSNKFICENCDFKCSKKEIIIDIY